MNGDVQIITDRAELVKLPTPRGTKSHKPVTHAKSTKQVADVIDELGYTIECERHEITNKGNRIFSNFVIKGEGDFRFVVGHRNSHDKVIARGVVAGTQVMCCSNMMFYGDFGTKVKHTQQIRDNWDGVIRDNVKIVLEGTQKRINERISSLKETEVSRADTNDIVVRAFEAKVLSPSKFTRVLDEIKNPRHAEFEVGTLWNVENAFTEFMKTQRMNQLGYTSARLRAIVDEYRN